MEELKRIVIKPQVKATILAFFTIAIGVLTSAAVNHYTNWIMWASLVALVAVYIVILIAYTKRETNLNTKIDELLGLARNVAFCVFNGIISHPSTAG